MMRPETAQALRKVDPAILAMPEDQWPSMQFDLWQAHRHAKALWDLMAISDRFDLIRKSPARD